MTATVPFTLATPDHTTVSSLACRWTAALIVAEAVTVTVPVVVLGAAIGFPGVLDQPAAIALKAFHDAQGAATFGYQIFVISSFLYIPLAPLLSRALGPDTSLGRVATAFGVAAGITQLLGFIRWLFLVPYFSQLYFDPQTSQATRDGVALIYDSFNVWAGGAVGEHLGFVFLGSWMVALAVLAARSRTLPTWMSVSGGVIGAALFASAFVRLLPTIGPLLEPLNFVANTVWVFWLLALSFFVLRARR
jgi:Domain of unknown function (DUF4386)